MGSIPIVSTTTLPKSDVTERVRLGYAAATEPGNQSETADRSVTLASGARTCQGLYVRVRCGRDQNVIHVVTETHDLELAATVPPTPVPAPVPRSQIPDWLHELDNETRRGVVDASAAIVEHVSAGVELPKQIALARAATRRARSSSCSPRWGDRGSEEPCERRSTSTSGRRLRIELAANRKSTPDGL